MPDWIKKYLMSTAATFAAPDEGGGNPDDGEERLEIQEDDDEISTDPVDEDDGEQDDDSPGEKSASADGGDEGEQPAPRQSRGERQYGELRRQARERAEENARLTRELAELRGQVTAMRQQPQETAQQRADRLALMSPEDRMEEQLNEALQSNARQQQELTTRLMDQSDQAAFEAKCQANPLLKKISGEVEKRRQEMYQREGNLVPRNVIATYLLGEKLLAQQGKVKPGAQQRRQQQTARPVRAQGDAVSGRRQRGTGDSVSDLEARFGDVPI